MPKIIHFRNDCIGCFSCVEHAPSNWEIGEDGKATLKRSKEKNNTFVATITEVEVECNRCAAMSCPVGVIRLQNDRGEVIE